MSSQPPSRSAHGLRSRSLPIHLYPLARRAGLRGGKVDMRMANDQQLRAIFTALAGPPPRPHPHNYRGHTLSRPRLNQGTARVTDSGQQYQVCTKNHQGCERYFPLTDPFPQRILNLPEIKNRLLIRQELAPTRRTRISLPVPPKPSPTLRIPAALPTPTVSQAHDISTSTNAASTVVTLDLGYPIRILLWTNADSAPKLLSNLYAGTDKKFRLNEYRTLLRVKGFRDDRPFELYMKSQEVWRPWDLDRPIPVFQSDEIVVLRAAGIVNLVDWDHFEPFIF
ncbi:hypothetical protein B0H11DRAFT_2200317 [Mycena galericulata]|nr:hypothetical protein B0H11DRAFT_2200317 [Mycena galericulata]